MKPVATAMPRESVIGRYAIHDEIAAGGMASVFLGRMRGERGFCRTVAIKRLHPQLAGDPEFVSMFVDEARLAARIQHRNVVAPLDVVTVDDRELLLVMEYVHGEALSRLIASCRRSNTRIPPAVAVAIVTDVLHGLHAAHEAVTDHGRPLDIVHRDVSPQNVLVGVEGVARVLDFGIAQASVRVDITPDGTAKGKLSYMAPEQIRCQPLDRRADVFAAAVVLWELLALMRLFQGDDQAQLETRITSAPILPPSQIPSRRSPRAGRGDGPRARAGSRAPVPVGLGVRQCPGTGAAAGQPRPGGRVAGRDGGARAGRTRPDAGPGGERRRRDVRAQAGREPAGSGSEPETRSFWPEAVGCGPGGRPTSDPPLPWPGGSARAMGVAAACAGRPAAQADPGHLGCERAVAGGGRADGVQLPVAGAPGG